MFKPNELPPIAAGQYEMVIKNIWQETDKPDVLRWKLEITSDGMFKGRTIDKWSYLTKGAYYFQRDLYGLGVDIEYLRQQKASGESLSLSLANLVLETKVQANLTRTPRKDIQGKDYINIEFQKKI